MSKRVLVCGGRDFNNKDLLWKTLDNLFIDEGDMLPNPNKISCIIQGGARGADLLADGWAVSNWVKSETYKPDWDTYGKSAGYRRNKDMLEKGKPDLVIAFPGGKGTKMMVDISNKAKVEVILVSEI